MRLTVPAGFRISVLICMCVTVFAAARQATAQAPSNGLYVFCSSDPDGATIYFSDIFIAIVGARLPHPMNTRGAVQS